MTINNIPQTMTKEIISSTEDLEYINKKLENYARAKQRTELPSKSNHSGSNSVACALKSAGRERKVEAENVVRDATVQALERVGRSTVSPDSNEPCLDEDCPIKIPHNKGRFFATGVKPDVLEESGLHSSGRSLIVSVSSFFNGTIPPLEIIDMYFRMNEAKADEDEVDKIRKYSMKHTYSPLISEVPTPIPVDIDIVTMYGMVYDLQGKDRTPLRDINRRIFNDLKILEDTPSLTTKEVPQRSSRDPQEYSIRGSQKQRTKYECEKESKASNCETPSNLGVTQQSHVPSTEKDATNSQPIQRIQFERSQANDVSTQERQMPEGDNLRDLQLDIQEAIIYSIAEQALSSEGDKTDSKPARFLADRFKRISTSLSRRQSTRSSARDTVSSNRHDKSTGHSVRDLRCELETHAAAVKKLESLTNDKDLDHLLSIVDTSGKELDADSKADMLEDLVLIARRALREIIFDYPSTVGEYIPSGVAVSEEDMEIVADDYLSTYDFMRDVYPHFRVKDVLESFDKIGERAKLSHLRGVTD